MSFAQRLALFQFLMVRVNFIVGVICGLLVLAIDPESNWVKVGIAVVAWWPVLVVYRFLVMFMLNICMSADEKQHIATVAKDLGL
jgi:hypothetical protein